MAGLDRQTWQRRSLRKVSPRTISPRTPVKVQCRLEFPVAASGRSRVCDRAPRQKPHIVRLLLHERLAQRAREGPVLCPTKSARRSPKFPRRYQGRPPCPRSEEHTSELQSLMRISYAVFCLKKKNNKTSTHKTKDDNP